MYGVQCGIVIVGSGIRLAARCAQLLLDIVVLGGQRVTLGGVVLDVAGRQLYDGFLTDGGFAQLGDLRIASLCGFARFR